MAVSPIPAGYHTATPYLVCDGAARVLDFILRAFDGRVQDKVERPDGTIMHADLIVGDSHVMISEGNEQWPATTAGVYLYVPDVDATYAKALAAGGVSLMEPADQFYGDRMGGVRDPAGNNWWLSTHVEDVTPEEMQRRQAAYLLASQD